MSSSAQSQTERLLILLLHAHLPDCRRPGRLCSLEETWFFQALSETYLPLIRMLDRLRDDGIPTPLTLSLSPTLLDQLRDPGLAKRWRNWMTQGRRFALSDAESGPDPIRKIASHQAETFADTVDFWQDRCGGDPVNRLIELAREGQIELVTTCATHAFLPAHQSMHRTVDTQVRAGLACFERHTGFRPTFFWLPECGYYPGLEEVLAENGIRCFGLESHGITQARPAPSAGTRSALRCPNGVVAFGRDAEASRLVWSATDGYPGHPDYREFHRDRIHGLPEEILRSPTRVAGPRLPSGLKYWRVTGPGDDKQPYCPKAAEALAQKHAADFVDRLLANTPPAAQDGDPPDIRFLPFDAELFGHWWFEGPVWLESLFRRLAQTTGITPVTAGEAIELCSSAPTGTPAPSSWGARGDYSHWINRKTDWLYPRLSDAEERFRALPTVIGRRPDATAQISKVDQTDALRERALLQAGRTLLLLQASDWPFMITSENVDELARKHLESLFSRFAQLCEGLENETLTPELVKMCEDTDASPSYLAPESVPSQDPASPRHAKGRI